MKQFILDKISIFSPSKKKLLLFTSLLLFLPFPSYFVAGRGLIPPFYTAIVVLAFIVPLVSGWTLALLVCYIALLPLTIYGISGFLAGKIKKMYVIWFIAAALVVLGYLFRLYYIVDTAGLRKTYNFIELYRELFPRWF